MIARDSSLPTSNMQQVYLKKSTSSGVLNGTEYGNALILHEAEAMCHKLHWIEEIVTIDGLYKITTVIL